MKLIKKLSFWKAIADFFLYLVLFGMLTKTVTSEFYPIASIFIFMGLVVTLIFLVKKISK